MSITQAQLQNRVVEAARGHKIGSEAARQAVKGALNDAYADGLLASAPQWITEIHVHAQLVGGEECCIQFQSVH